MLSLVFAKMYYALSSLDLHACHSGGASTCTIEERFLQSHATLCFAFYGLVSCVKK